MENLRAVMKALSFRIRVIGLGLGLILGLQMIAYGQSAVATNGSAAQLKSSDVIRLMINARSLSSTEAETLEQKLVADPKDLQSRITLLSHYSFGKDPAVRLKKDEHALWFIKNVPDAEFLHWIYQVRLDPIIDARFNEAKQAWLSNLETYKGNLIVLSNATDFFLITDPELAEKLIKQGAAADPQNPQWPGELGAIYTNQTHRATGEMRRSLASKAYQQFETAYHLSRNGSERRMWISPLMTAAFEAGDSAKAQVWAQEALNQKSTSTDSSIADAAHHAHIILGRIALTSNDVAGAREQLLLAGQVSGSPVLGSFGPNMTLAKELLEKGERETVVKYFEECALFWKKDQGKLAEWTAAVKNGDVPKFGPNLIY